MLLTLQKLYYQNANLNPFFAINRLLLWSRKKQTKYSIKTLTKYLKHMMINFCGLSSVTTLFQYQLLRRVLAIFFADFVFIDLFWYRENNITHYHNWLMILWCNFCCCVIKIMQLYDSLFWWKEFIEINTMASCCCLKMLQIL